MTLRTPPAANVVGEGVHARTGTTCCAGQPTTHRPCSPTQSRANVVAHQDVRRPIATWGAACRGGTATLPDHDGKCSLSMVHDFTFHPSSSLMIGDGNPRRLGFEPP